jgi:hypothetical protein
VDANSRTRYLDAYNFCHNIVQMKKGDVIKGAATSLFSFFLTFPSSALSDVSFAQKMNVRVFKEGDGGKADVRGAVGG